jgi:curved DNA-binding protein CbpA
MSRVTPVIYKCTLLRSKRRDFSKCVFSLEIMPFLSQKVVFNRFNRKKLQLSFRSRTRIFGASNDTREGKQEQLEEILKLVDTWNCVLRVIGGETILVLLNPVDNKSLRVVWEWAKDNVDVVQSYLVENTERTLSDNLRNRKYNIPGKMMLKMDTEEWQYFLIKGETKFSMAEIKLEEMPREWDDINRGSSGIGGGRRR